MKAISELTAEDAAQVRYILMDIDDTLTLQGKLLASSYSALWKLKNTGYKIIPVTGRPAGWCDLIARQWPVDGVIGENGALAFWEYTKKPRARHRACNSNNVDKYKSLPVLKAEYHPNGCRCAYRSPAYQ